MWFAIVSVLLFCTSMVEAYECGKPVVRMRKRQAAERYFNRIVGGWEAVPHSFPWQVRVMTHQYGNMYGACGGSLIQLNPGNSTDLVLTAAHCFEDNGQYPSASKIKVIAGAHNLDDPYESTRMEIGVQDFAHHLYDTSTNANDIALLRLKQAVPHSDATIPVCLPKPNEAIPIGNVCYVTGWGTTSEDGATSRQLRQVDAEILNQSKCKGTQRTDVMFCAGTVMGGKDSCQGDSGGPLVCETNGKFVQYGVVSFGIGCARVNYPGVYATVPAFVNWVNEKSKTLLPSSGSTKPGEISPGKSPSSGWAPSRPGLSSQIGFPSLSGGLSSFGSSVPSDVESLLSQMGYKPGSGASGTYTVTTYVNGKPSVQTYKF
uniref:Peptidase S1 domain-containing protein n=1 Tax=Trichuris muris TaxID=70415 RepID=A0A5S6QHH2_TRIMR